MIKNLFPFTKIITYFSFVLIFVNESGPDLYAQDTIDAGNDTVICYGNSVQLGGDPTASGTSTSYDYSWTSDTGSGNYDSTIANPTVSPSSNTTYYLEVTASSSGKLYDTVSVDVVQPPDADFSFNDYVCSGSSVSFNNTSSNANSYNWDFGNGNTSKATSPSQVYDLSNTGNDTVSFVVTLEASNQGCTVSKTNTIYVKQLPDASLSAPTTGFDNCGSASSSNPYFELKIYNTSNTPNSQYSIDWGDGTQPFDTTSSSTWEKLHTYTSLGVYTLTSTVTSDNGCSTTETYTVKNIANPAISFGNPGNTQECAPMKICFPIQGYDDNDSSTTYRVDFGDGSPDTLLNHPPPDSICHTYTKTSCGNDENSCSDCYVASITAENACDKTTNTTDNIKVFKTVETDFDAPLKSCVNQGIKIKNKSSYGFNNNCEKNAVFTWHFGDGTTLTSFSYNDTINHSYNSPGIYTIKLIGENYCGSDSITKTICVVPDVVADFSLALGGCAPDTLTLNNLTSTPSSSCDTTTYSWDINGSSECDPPNGSYQYINGTSSSSLAPQVVFNSSGDYDITLTASNYCGTADTTKSVTIKSKPQVTLSTLPDSICLGDSVTPSGTVKNCKSPASYNWSMPGSTTPSSTSSSPGKITYLDSGSYTITLKGINSCGTTAVSKDIYVYGLPDIFIPQFSSLCVDQGVKQLTGATPTGGNYSGSGVNSSGEFDPSSVGPGTYDIIYEYTDNNGCTNSDTSQITVHPLPDVTMADLDTLCLNDPPLSLDAGSPTNSSSYYYGPGVNNDTLYPDSAGVGTHTIYYVYTDANGCADTASSPVVVNDLPKVNASDTTLCNQPIPVQLSASPNGGTWQSGPYNDTNGVFTPGSTGVFNVIYTYIDPSTGCSNQDTSEIEVVDPTYADAGNDTSVCLNSGSFALTSATPAGGDWSGPNVTLNGVYNPGSVGTFKLYYSIGVGTCKNKDSIEVTVDPLPVADAGLDTIVCKNDTIELNGNASAGTSPYSYSWSPASSLSSSNTQNVYASPVNDEDYLFKVIDSNGCIDSSFVSVEVKDLPEVQADDLNICIGDSGVINTTISGNSPFTINWSPNHKINNVTAQSPTVFPLNDTNYVIQVVDKNSCANNDTSEITVSPNPSPDFSVPSNQCSPAVIDFNNTTANLNSNSYLWDFDDGTTSTQTHPTHTIVNNSHVQDTTFHVTLTATTGTGCSDSIEKPITVYPQPLADFTFDTLEQCAPAVISVTNQSEYKSTNA
ncbi:MAG: PKD domain-containing protein, partial [Bacteroidales bacterium]|nr:PKD domain-containing protein [Bacteroidales bacterium]